MGSVDDLVPDASLERVEHALDDPDLAGRQVAYGHGPDLAVRVRLDRVQDGLRGGVRRQDLQVIVAACGRLPELGEDIGALVGQGCLLGVPLRERVHRQPRRTDHQAVVDSFDQAEPDAVQSAVPQQLSPEIQQIVDNLPAMRARADAVRAQLGLPDDPVRSPAAPMESSPTRSRTIKDLRRFWDIPSSDIELVPAHGRSMLDPEVNYRVFTAVYGFNAEQSRVSADLVARELNSATLGYGDLRIFTFNAYAASGGETIPGYGIAPKRIAFGDGVMEGFAQVGLGDVAPQAILAYEFGHHVQYAGGLMRDDLPAPEASRWAELMPDAFSAYFLTHARGASMNWKRVQSFGQMFYQLGDCGFTAAGHHGTPNSGCARPSGRTASPTRPVHRVTSCRPAASTTCSQRSTPTLIAPDATA
ncbi:hypothetical protein E0H75_00860 [Kribbella capetownensis]|uniref:Uncharacterized protein n=1 Tax=Kribbella capetownensis TaxID=1572659 RepID=A0A4R0JXT9_9ACTN|nr:hypothetical protein [Kribbella capetownensis]TCC52371.1 hypothetical protein E0H75_00860 [Kribbella capetownensis]